MSARHKILLLDDEQDLLDLYREMLSQLPSKPEIHTANAGARAIAMLESEPFSLLISDLNMPKMDGLQVLSIVRKKMPDLRIVVMTSVMDEQYRARAYAMGVDLFWQKPGTEQEIKLFLECVESLLGREEKVGGFRGVQSKSLVDLIQLECLSQNSSVLKITQGSTEARIWIKDGDVIDAAINDLTGEAAFRKILTLRSGNFETQPPGGDRPRTIFNSYQGLLLDASQAIDEAQSGEVPPERGAEAGVVASVGPLQATGKFDGVEFVLAVPTDEKKNFESIRLENPEPLSKWTRQLLHNLSALGDRFSAGQLQRVEGRGGQRHVLLLPLKETQLCVGLVRTMPGDQLAETAKKIVAKWES